MPDPKDELTNLLVTIFKKMGIDLIYAATILCCLFLISYRKVFKNWGKEHYFNKLLAISAVFATCILLFLSFLKILGRF